MSMGCALLDGLSHRSFDVGDDHIVELEITPEIRGPSGAVHGGLIASLVDRAGAYSAHAASNRTVATSTLSMSYLAAATHGPLRAVATNLRIGRQQGVVEVRVHDAGRDDVLVATALVTLSFLTDHLSGAANGEDGRASTHTRSTTGPRESAGDGHGPGDSDVSATSGAVGAHDGDA